MTTIDLTLLKNHRFGVAPAMANTGGSPLPYRIDHLVDHGMHLHYTDAPHHPRLDSLHDPIVQTVALAPHLVRHPATLAVFESSAHPWGVARHYLPFLRRSVFVVLTCWLTEVLVGADARRLRRYRQAYDTVDRLFVFSRNQEPLLAELLGLEPDRIRSLTLGIDADEFQPPGGEATGPYLAVGRDRGRDWPTLLAALRVTGVATQVLCRRSELAGLDLPSNVEVLGIVDRDDYRRLLQRARGVLIPTQVLAYPTGQSVLLEAMACGRPVIVTRTPALSDYLDPGRTALTVAPRDFDGWVDTIRALDRGHVDGDQLGRDARAEVERSFRAEHMWSTVAHDLRALLDERHGDR